jgi:DNA-binding CsgD family transcriptional regulator
VEFHLTGAYAKLGVTSRIAAVVKALNLGLIRP